jgi:hypothetical protein
MTKRRAAIATRELEEQEAKDNDKDYDSNSDEEGSEDNIAANERGGKRGMQRKIDYKRRKTPLHSSRSKLHGMNDE